MSPPQYNNKDKICPPKDNFLIQNALCAFFNNFGGYYRVLINYARLPITCQTDKRRQYPTRRDNELAREDKDEGLFLVPQGRGREEIGRRLFASYLAVEEKKSLFARRGGLEEKWWKSLDKWREEGLVEAV